MRLSNISSATLFAADNNFKRFLKRASSCNNYFSISDNPFYGKVNSNGDIIYLSENYLSSLSTKDGQTVYALNFVVDAFKDFKEYYLKAVNTNIVKNDILREAVYPVSGWKSAHEIYARDIQGLYYILVNKYLQNPLKTQGAITKNFDDFMSLTIKLFDYVGKNMHLSRSSFIVSTNCPISTTGLVLDILPPDAKSVDIFTSVNYDFYVKSLKKFGFMLDINNPKRIVADIGSTAMQNYMQKYDVTIDNLFSKYFYKAKDYDYDLIKVYLTQFYNNYAKDYPVLSKVTKAGRVNIEKYYLEKQNNSKVNKIPFPSGKIACDKTLTEVIQRQQLSQQQMDSQYNDAYWISYYPQIMNYEMGKPLDNKQINKVVKNCKHIHKTVGIDEAKSYVSGVFKILRFPTSSQISTTPMKSNLLTSASSSDIIETSTATTTSAPASGGSSGGGGY